MKTKRIKLEMHYIVEQADEKTTTIYRFTDKEFIKKILEQCRDEFVKKSLEIIGG